MSTPGATSALAPGLPPLAAAIETLQQAAAAGPCAFACSFGVEDIVVIDLIRQHAAAIEIFSLDTGRLPEETHDLMQRVQARYGRVVTVYFPDAAAVQALVRAQGINGFYASVDNRHACCGVRKMEPLKRALAGKAAWVTGLRREQSKDRAQTAAREWDAANGIVKFNPLVDWTEAQVWDYVRAHELPYNALHDRGYPSIGCAPCTRAVEPGADPRAGRWWWEHEVAKECGLHLRRVAVDG